VHALGKLQCFEWFKKFKSDDFDVRNEERGKPCDEKWIYFKNPKRKRSWVTPGEPSTSTARPNRYGRKIMLCVW